MTPRTAAETFKGLILDIDGTLYRANRPIPGAAEAVRAVRQAGRNIVFVTNALEHPAWHAEKLNRYGIPAEPGDVIHAPGALIRYLRREMPGATVFAIGQPVLSEALTPEFRLSEDPDKIDVVVASYDPEFDYRKLTIGFKALRRGARFLATNGDATCPVEDDELPDAAAIIGALEGCSRRKLEQITGKPSPLMLDAALERLGLRPDECLIVGDRLETDIQMGQAAHMATALVLTGVAGREELPGAPIHPDVVLDSIAELPDWLGDR